MQSHLEVKSSDKVSPHHLLCLVCGAGFPLNPGLGGCRMEPDLWFGAIKVFIDARLLLPGSERGKIWAEHLPGPVPVRDL